MRLPIGAVITERKNNDPSGKSQQTLISFTGIVSAPNNELSAVFNVFGRRIVIPNAAISSQVKDQVQTVLADYENAGLYVRNVTSISSTSIAFEHNDHKDHVAPFWTQHGITMSGIVSSPASKGYGQWQKFAETTVTELDGTTVSNLYHWERIS